MADEIRKLLRIIEFGVAGYFILTAALFWNVPSSLSPAVYGQWASLTPREWSIIMGVSGVIHLAALWLNGRDRLVSSFVRVIACCTHLTISIVFCYMFWASGLYWGCILFGFLIPWNTYVVGKQAVMQLALVYDSKEARYAHNGSH